jgi:hypothetical protein
MQMNCMHSKAPQAKALQPTNPVALGLAVSPFAQMSMVMADPNHSAEMVFPPCSTEAAVPAAAKLYYHDQAC